MNKQRINTVLFDFDGVLLNSAADITAAVNAALSKFDYGPLTMERVNSFVGDGAVKLIERALEAGFNDRGERFDTELHKKHVNTLLPIYIEYYHNHCAVHSSLYDGVQELLTTLHERGIKIGLVSNKPLSLCHIILEHFGIERFFGAVLGPENIIRLKPAPDGLFTALEILGGSADTALMVGDSASDIKAAKAAGVFSCAVNGMGNVDALIATDPDIVLDSVDQLLTNARFIFE
jgi:phosphoglycolate phosphatase